ncbi:MAG: primosomal protein N' [Gammaproteobacteria bacterium]|nr:primosomal protein N' [Gammaproteobacteria bacterium]
MVHVALDAPLPHGFDYQTPTSLNPDDIKTGARVRVPFRRGSRIGLVLEKRTTSQLPSNKVKAVSELLDRHAIVSDELLSLLSWASRYYHHPIGEVIAAALPKWIRQGRSLDSKQNAWRLTHKLGDEHIDNIARQAKLQGKLLRALKEDAAGVAEEALKHLGSSWRQSLKRLEERDLVQKIELVINADSNVLPTSVSEVLAQSGPTLSDEQQHAVETILASRNQASSFLLHGVTGSGKTEVYLRCLQELLAAGKQALILVPEIGLTPQLLSRFRARFNVPILAYHSALSDGERFDAWKRCRQTQPLIVVGTRSSVFLPFANLGMVVVDEEHDHSFKQQEGFRYSARDLAVVRAHRHDIPVVLGTATPSFESLVNVERQEEKHRFVELVLSHRPGMAQTPTVNCIDLRRQPIEHGLSLTLREQIQAQLDEGAQVLLFINRRGFAPVWFCSQCSWVALCNDCDARLVFHKHQDLLRCHHCGHQQSKPDLCPSCTEPLKPSGLGTERVESALIDQFKVPIYRIDSDSTQRKGSLEAMFDEIHHGDPCILIGTQILSKGHHFADVTLVGIINADYGLFGTDFRAMEQLAQVIVQVSGRAGREQRPGRVLIQTYHPEHPLLMELIDRGYAGFAKNALAERRLANWPPYSRLALVRCSASQAALPMRFLKQAFECANHDKTVELLGPAPAPMLKRAGRYHAQLLIRSQARKPLHQFLNQWLPRVRTLKLANRLRWSVDVDPIDLF